MEKRSLAIITARGGSKRIPRKNIKEFCGKPIIAYSIEAALQSGVFEEVMVSTDDEEIAEIAKKYGAKVPFMRSDETANDYATTVDVIKEVIYEYEKRNYFFDTFCCIYPTAPFLTANDLLKSKKILETGEYEAVVPVVRFSYPIQRALKEEDGFGVFRESEMMNARSQDLEAFYHDAGQFYWANTESFREKQQFIGNRCKMFELSEIKVQDIDTEEDWKMAELKYRLLQGEKNEFIS